MDLFDRIDQPTLLLNEEVVRQNIARMTARAHTQQVRFRPHFKTHQSAQIGEWFRAVGVEAITVSSVGMAEYFADHGWKDILIAFSLNPRQVLRINALAARVNLGVLVENPHGIDALQTSLKFPVDVWIKVDVGNARTGVNWQEADTIASLCHKVTGSPLLRLAGLLTHSGHTYHARHKADVVHLFREGVERLNRLRTELTHIGYEQLKVSTGDTPGCTLCGDWSGIDEIRPGNFIFYDAQQAVAGVCMYEDIGVALACPVVAKHAARREVVIYGGAVHLSKDRVEIGEDFSYGLPALQAGEGWGMPIPGARVDRLSQEHGVLVVPGAAYDEIEIGGLVFILPAHSCLTVHEMGGYLTLSGETISSWRE